ncbi:MAG: methionine--tRNA ligase subunit beta, partial [Syntrophomonadaceae bacterium]|nr:methionine--tRNA ligase subunit beta [Syntrophomonadaceae bacterium]
ARANKYIDETEPWLLAKDENKKNRLATVMYNLTESIRIILTMLAPAMPNLPERANRQMQVFADPGQIKWEDAGRWGLVKSGAKVKKDEILFPRIDLKTLEEENIMDDNKVDIGDNNAAKEKEEKQPEYIGIEDFARVDLRVAEVIACEKMEKADKLLVLRVRMGEEERTVVSGIAKNYQPEELVGKKVVLVANLKPTKLRGTLSQGMILAASDPDDNDIEVLTLDRITSGNRVK